MAQRLFDNEVSTQNCAKASTTLSVRMLPTTPNHFLSIFFVFLSIIVLSSGEPVQVCSSEINITFDPTTAQCISACHCTNVPPESTLIFDISLTSAGFLSQDYVFVSVVETKNNQCPAVKCVTSELCGTNSNDLHVPILEVIKLNNTDTQDLTVSFYNPLFASNLLVTGYCYYQYEETPPTNSWFYITTSVIVFLVLLICGIFIVVAFFGINKYRASNKFVDWDEL